MLCLMNKCVIRRGKSLLWCELSDFGDFMKIDEEPYPLYCVVMKIFQGKMNPNRTVYGGFCRSLNEILFPVGEIFIYIYKS